MFLFDKHACRLVSSSTSSSFQSAGSIPHLDRLLISDSESDQEHAAAAIWSLTAGNAKAAAVVVTLAPGCNAVLLQLSTGSPNAAVRANATGAARSISAWA